jgi:phospholipase/carboxylesterase
MNVPIEWLPARAPRTTDPAAARLGRRGRSMAPLAQALRLVSAGGRAGARCAARPTAGDGTARQWYSTGLTPANCPTRVAAALPGLRQWVQAQQQRLGVARRPPAWAGFSQGRHAGAGTGPAARRHRRPRAGLWRPPCTAARRPRRATPRCTCFTAPDDDLIPADGARQALEHLAALQGDATLDIARAWATSCTRR